MILRTNPTRMTSQERARMLLDAIRTLRSQRSLKPEERRRGIQTLKEAYRRETGSPRKD